MNIARLMVVLISFVGILGCGAGPAIPDDKQLSDEDPKEDVTSAFSPISLLIEDGKVATNNLTVSLSLTVQNADEMYITADEACKTGGVWAPLALTTTTVLPLPNQENKLYLKFKNTRRPSFGESECVGASIIHDDIAPVVTFSTPSPDSYVNSVTASNLVLSGTCTEENRVVTLEGSSASLATCREGSWAAALDLTLVPDGPLAITASLTDLAENVSSPVSLSLQKDTVPPTLAISSPLATDTINNSNLTNFSFSGTCDEEGQTVFFSGAITASALCSGGSFSTSLDLTAVPDGPVQFILDFSDLAGNPAPTQSLTLSKDTSGPAPSSLAINAGATATNSTAVTLSLVSTDATEMYLTEVSDCSSGGSWVPYNSNPSWNLTSTNAINSVYGKFRTSTGNESLCVSDSIIHDNIAPLWSAAPTHAAYGTTLTSTPVVTYSENATDSLGSGIEKYQYAIGSGTNGAAAIDIAPWSDVASGSFTRGGLSLTDGDTYYVNMQALDMAGNSVQKSSVGWIVDASPPVISITQPLANSVVTERDIRIKGTCDTAGSIDLSYGAAITGPPSVTCTAGLINFLVKISGGSGSRNLTLSQSDIAGNVTTLNVTYNFKLNLSFGGSVLATRKLQDGSTIYGGNFTTVVLEREMSLARAGLDGAKDLSFVVGGGFNGPIYSVAEMADGSVLVGGAFTTYRGEVANYLAKLDSTGALDTAFSPPSGANGTSGAVRAIVIDGSQIFLGGDFTKYQGKTVYRIAKINASGVLDLTFKGTGTIGFSSGSIYSMISYGGSLYVGGSFTLYRGGAANRIAKIDPTTGNLDTTFNPTSGSNGTNSSVRAISAIGSDIYIGGDFVTYRGSSIKYLARIASDGVLNTGFDSTTRANVAIYALATDGLSLFVGGKFTTYKSAPAKYVAKLDPNTALLDTTFSPPTGTNGVNKMVRSLFASASHLYLGGDFTSYRGASASFTAKVNFSGVLDTTYSPSTGDNGASGIVYAILASATKVYLGGEFASYRSFFRANYVAKVSAAGVFDTTFSPQSGANGFSALVRAIDVSGSQVFVGGDFTKYRGAKANQIAKLNESGDLDTTFNPPTGGNGVNNKAVWSVAVSGTDVFIGGLFTTYRGTSAKYLAKIDFNGNLDSTFSTTSGPSSYVYSIAANATDVFVGGKFTTYKGISANRIAKLNALTAALDTAFTPTGSNGVNNVVYSLALEGGSLYLGGTFTSHLTGGTKTVNRIAKVSTTSGLLDSTFTGTGTVGFNSTVYGLTSDGVSVYAAGAFSTYRGVASKKLAKVSSSEGALDLNFSAGGGLTGTGVVGNSVLWDGSALLVGGVFSQYRGYITLNSAWLTSNGDLY